MSALAGTLAFLGTMAAVLTRQTFRVPQAVKAPAEPDHPVEVAVTTGPSWEFHNPEINKLIEELHTNRLALAKRESQLNELSKRIQSDLQDLSQITQRVAQLQKEFDKNVVKVTADESVNLKRLAKVYAKMTPAGAAHIFKEMDDEQVTKQLYCMKENEAGLILEAFAREQPPAVMSKRAAAIANRMRVASETSAKSKEKAKSP